MAELTFGTDPELFAIKGDLPVPAHRLGFPSKEDRRRFHDGTSVYRDGYAVELNVVPDPYPLGLTWRMKHALMHAQRMVPPKSGVDLSPTPAVRINLKRDLRKAPPDVQQFGCEPAYNAYTRSVVVPEIDAGTHSWRYSGAHLHFGTCTCEKCAESLLATTSNYPMLAKLMDRYVGVPLTFLFNRPEQYLRRKYYGCAGEFRIQKYSETAGGFEYRTPGPELWNASWIASLALESARWVIRNFKSLSETWDAGADDLLQEAINTGHGLTKLIGEVPGVYDPTLMRRLARIQTRWQPRLLYGEVTSIQKFTARLPKRR